MGSCLFSLRYQPMWEAQLKFAAGQPGGAPLRLQLEGYDALRQEGVLPVDAAFLESAVDQLLQRMPTEATEMGKMLEQIIGIYSNDGQWDAATRALTLLRGHELIAPDYHEGMLQQLQSRRQVREAFISQYRGS